MKNGRPQHNSQPNIQSTLKRTGRDGRSPNISHSSRKSQEKLRPLMYIGKMNKLLRVFSIVILILVAIAVILYQTPFTGLPTPGEIDDHLVRPSVQIVDRVKRPYKIGR